MIAVVWACDVAVGATARTAYGVRDAYPCPAVSRAATTADVLRTVAGRDGWVLLPDGSHRCPYHASATS